MLQVTGKAFVGMPSRFDLIHGPWILASYYLNFFAQYAVISRLFNSTNCSGLDAWLLRAVDNGRHGSHCFM